MWDLPGGRPTHGESIFQTLQREVEEETGVKLQEATPFLNEVFVVDYKDQEELISLHHISLVYKATQFDCMNLIDTIYEEDVAGCAWIDKSQLNHLSVSKVVQSVL